VGILIPTSTIDSIPSPVLRQTIPNGAVEGYPSRLPCMPRPPEVQCPWREVLIPVSSYNFSGGRRAGRVVVVVAKVEIHGMDGREPSRLSPRPLLICEVSMLKAAS